MSKPRPPTSAIEQTRDPGRVWLFVALALTFVIRLWFVLSMRGQPFSFIGPQYVDSYFYHKWAVEIISGNFWGSDVFFLRPLYPYLLAILYSIFGQHVHRNSSDGRADQVHHSMINGVGLLITE